MAAPHSDSHSQNSPWNQLLPDLLLLYLCSSGRMCHLNKSSISTTEAMLGVEGSSRGTGQEAQGTGIGFLSLLPCTCHLMCNVPFSELVPPGGIQLKEK